MGVNNNKKVIITGSHICLAVGLLSAACLIYWLVQAIFYGNDDFLMIFLSMATTIAALWYGYRKKK